MARNEIDLYGLLWHPSVDPLSREIAMIRKGGRWRKRNGKYAGEGLFYHFKRAQEILWPEIKWHRWRDLETKCFLEYRYIGEMGCAAAGKSDTAAANVLLDWYCWPSCTTVLVSSTELKMLEVRIWGMVKKYHKLARQRFPFIPGHLIEGKQVIIYDPKEKAAEGREFKNGIIAVPCKKGGAFIGLGSYIGVHNARVRLVADELQLMPRAFMDATANLSKNQFFAMIGLGNPNETNNAHGQLCEPAAHLGGWESGMDQNPGTKTWETRYPKGICIQLPGSDSPNFDAPSGAPPPFPFLVTRQQMEQDAAIWGTEDWHFTMMNEARMPRGQGSCRVITRQMCEKFGAMDDPVWGSVLRTRIGFLDAAFGAVGGDRCIFGELQFGPEATAPDAGQVLTSLVSQSPPRNNARHILAIIDIVVIPIESRRLADLPQDQIVSECRAQCERRGIPPENFFYDASMRGSLVSAFARLWSPQCNPIDSLGKASDRKVSSDIDAVCADYYGNKVTEMWYSVRMVIESRQMRSLPREAISEFCAREFKRVSKNSKMTRIQVESKEEMKPKIARSPDIADAISYGIEGARQRGFVIARVSNEDVGRSRSNWRLELERRAAQLISSKELVYSA